MGVPAPGAIGVTVAVSMTGCPAVVAVGEAVSEAVVPAIFTV